MNGICTCCGEFTPDESPLCTKCKNDILRNSFESHEECEHYNSNGYFFELTGFDCIGTKCASFKKNTDSK